MIPIVHRKKKDRVFPVPRGDVTTKLSLGGNNDVITKLFLPSGSLVSDILAGDGKLVNIFLRGFALEITLTAFFCFRIRGVNVVLFAEPYTLIQYVIQMYINLGVCTVYIIRLYNLYLLAGSSLLLCI